MTYRISGLDPAPFPPLFALDDAALAERGVKRMIADTRPGFPCRVTLDDAEPGQEMLLLNHVSVPHGIYQASQAIFVSAEVAAAANYCGTIPPALDRRILSLRAFNGSFDMVAAELVEPGAADAAIRRLLADAAVATIHAHYATRGCYAALVERA